MGWLSSIAFAQNPNSNAGGLNWKITGNQATTTDFIGTTNNQKLVLKCNSITALEIAPNSESKFMGDLVLDKLKPVIPMPPGEVRIVTSDNNGKLTSLDRSGLLNAIYDDQLQCRTDLNGLFVPTWSAKGLTPTLGALYTGVNCPAWVGIGTDNPTVSLDVRGSGLFTQTVEIGTNTAPINFSTQLKINAINRQSGILLINRPIANATIPLYGFKNIVNTNTIIAYSVTQESTNQDVFKVFGNGTLLFEQNAPDLAKTISIKDNTSGKDVFRVLSDGHIWATELDLALKEDFPDYVFDKNYTLMSLTELENYITNNKHLPNIPTALQIKENGMSVGEMQVKQMEKIEELTLYLIELSKQIEALKTENNKLRKIINH